MALASVLRRRWPSAGRSFPWSAPNWPQTLSRPEPERELGLDYPTEWARRYPARLVRAVLLDNVTRPLTHLVASPEVRGEEVLELVEPPVIFFANHASHIDTPLLLSVLPPRFRHRTAVAAAADHFFDRRWKAHLWSLTLAAVPIERQRVNRRSAELAADLIEDGWNLVIYPEGGRSADGWFGEFHVGSALPAVRTGCRVVPVHIEGTYRVLPRDGNRLHRSPTRVTFGTPISPEAGEDARHLGARVYQALAVLADEASTDFWSARRRAATGDTTSPRGPQVSAWRRSWALGPGPGDPDDTDPGRWAVSRRR
ncbi:MAG TPA: lysophospholipid acyltransferase family protein [Acidimicrobiales bacterium]|nr:lysophospholipid acyltransferase family protein [Acidimicrobiales bacterium]